MGTKNIMIVGSNKFCYLSLIFKPPSLNIERAENTRSICSPFVDKGKLRAFLKDLLLKELENYTI
jgi:hypothetical protein